MPLMDKPEHFSAEGYRKLQQDSSPEEWRNEALRACQSTSTESEVAAIFDLYCAGKKLCADPPEQLNPGERLGHVKPEATSIARIAVAIRFDIPFVEQQFRFLAGENSQDDYRQAREFFEEHLVLGIGGNLPISGRPSWLFRTDSAAGDPFDGDNSCLPWRLALPIAADPNLRSIRCLGYRISMSACGDARRPTAFDAGYEGLKFCWHPGGETVPHPHSPCSAPGLKEVVVEPPLFKQIEREIVAFTARRP